MSELARTQRELADALRDGDTPAAAFAERIAAGSERLTPAMQLDIYREQFFLRHVDVLRDDFRSLAHLLGKGGFENLAKAYLKAFPPASFTLRDLGRDLASFVAKTPPWAGDALVFDLARTEWAFVEAFDALDAPPLALEAVAAVPEDAWPSARVVLQPAVQLLALSHPAHDYRLAVRKDEHPERPAPASSWVVVFRGAELLQCLDVDADAFALLQELAHGSALGEACERVAMASGAAEATFEAKVGAWFQQWTALGWMSRIEL